MAARLNTRHQETVRDKIQASQLINRLQDHALGDLELSASQIKAIEVLLRKSIPDLSAVQVSGDSESPLAHKIEMVIVDPQG
jgi:phage repressor protein C with HTH and peptisase S24 domain